MSGDNRDWYRDWWRKRTGYVERAAFRVSEADRQHRRYRRAWRSNFIWGAVIVSAVLALVLLKRFGM